MEKIKGQIEECIKSISENGISANEIDYLGKLVDIHKDLEMEEYHKEKIKLKKEANDMRYREYGEGYGRRGRYNDYGEGEYGRRRRDSRGRYRGNYGHYMPEDMMEEMMEHYQNYSEANEEYGRGNYGAEGDMKKSVEGIMKNIYSIIEVLSEGDNPEVMQIIQKYSKKISEMQ